MSAFTFLHAADLHLGSPFLGLSLKDEELARRLAAAGREAFRALVDAAIAERVAFVVIAGDVYDGQWRDASIGLFFNREVARLDRAGIPVFLIKGNHDAESVVTKSITLPESVAEFPSRAATSFRIEALKVALHGRSFPDRAVTENYALTYPAALPGWFNIGVLHTSCTGRPPHDTYAPCTLQDLAGRGYQYWALGHVHEHEVLSQDPYVVYPGNIQGRSIRETGSKGAVLVDVEDGVVRGLRRLILDRARFVYLRVGLDDSETLDQALRAVEEALRPEVREADGRLLLARLELTGETTLHRRLAADAEALRDEVQAAAHRLHEDAFIEDLLLPTGEPKGAEAPSPQDEQAGLLDPARLLAGLEADAALRCEAAALLGQIAAKLPASVGDIAPPLADELDLLLGEAKALVLGRLTREDG